MSVEIAYVVKCDAPGCTRRLFREAVGPGDAFGQALGSYWVAGEPGTGKIYCWDHGEVR